MKLKQGGTNSSKRNKCPSKIRGKAFQRIIHNGDNKYPTAVRDVLRRLFHQTEVMMSE